MNLNILAFADTRTSLVLPECEPDLVLLLGDIPSKITNRVDKKYHCPIVGVFGNHCHPLNFEDTSILNIHEKVITIKGITIAGFEGAPKYKEKKFGQHSEREAVRFISSINKPVDIFIAHSNPVYDDMNLDDTHKGFEAFNELFFGPRDNIKYFFHGHLHDPFHKQINHSNVYSVYSYLYLPIVL